MHTRSASHGSAALCGEASRRSTCADQSFACWLCAIHATCPRHVGVSVWGMCLVDGMRMFACDKEKLRAITHRRMPELAFSVCDIDEVTEAPGEERRVLKFCGSYVLGAKDLGHLQTPSESMFSSSKNVFRKVLNLCKQQEIS